LKETHPALNLLLKKPGVFPGLEEMVAGFDGLVVVRSVFLKSTSALGSLFVVKLGVLETNKTEHLVGSVSEWVQRLDSDVVLVFDNLREFARACGIVSLDDRAFFDATDMPDSNIFTDSVCRLRTASKSGDFVLYHFAVSGDERRA